MDTATDAIVIASGKGMIRYWNEASARRWNWPAQDAIGQHLGKLLFADQAQHGAIRATLRDAGRWHGYIVTVTKSGALKVLHASISVCEPDATGEPGYLMICREPQSLASDAAALSRLEWLESFARSATGAGQALGNALSLFTMSLDLLRERLSEPRDAAVLGMLEAAVDNATKVLANLASSAQMPSEAERSSEES